MDGQEIIHMDSPHQGFGDTSLCGHDLIGDTSMGWEAGIETKKKITCPHCINIVKFCKAVKLSEIGQTHESMKLPE